MNNLVEDCLGYLDGGYIRPPDDRAKLRLLLPRKERGTPRVLSARLGNDGAGKRVDEVDLPKGGAKIEECRVRLSAGIG